MRHIKFFGAHLDLIQDPDTREYIQEVYDRFVINTNVYAGKGDQKKNQQNRDQSQKNDLMKKNVVIDQHELERQMKKDFAEGTEIWEYQDVEGVSTLVNYSMSLTKMQKADTLISIPETELKMMSPSDDFCVFKSLANLAYFTHDDPRACEEAFAMAKATAVKGETKGHEGSFVRKVCRRLGIN